MRTPIVLSSCLEAKLTVVILLRRKWLLILSKLADSIETEHIKTVCIQTQYLDSWLGTYKHVIYWIHSYRPRGHVVVRFSNHSWWLWPPVGIGNHLRPGTYTVRWLHEVRMVTLPYGGHHGWACKRCFWRLAIIYDFGTNDYEPQHHSSIYAKAYMHGEGRHPTTPDLL